MEKITRWMFVVAAAILLLYSGWRFWSVSLQLRDAEAILDGLRQEERNLLSDLPGQETGAGEMEIARDKGIDELLCRRLR